MKKFLLLAALAAPAAGAFAQAAADGSVKVGYTLPAGAFYSGDDALLPPHVQLQWLNTTYIKGQGLLTDAEYTWTANYGKEGIKVIGTDLDLTTDPNFSLPALNIAAGLKPILATDDEADGDHSFGGNIYYGAAPAAATAFKSYTGATAGEFKAFQTGSSEAVAGWASLYPDLQNISVTGFAQKLTYAGAPYVLNGLTVNGAKGEYMVEVFAAPAEGSALPTEPIISAYPVTGATAVDFTEGGKSAAPVIKGDIIIAITEIAEAAFEPAVALAKVEEGVPTPANQGLYAILSATANDGNQVATLAEWTEPEAGVLPVALDLNLNVAYTYLIPVKQTGSETTLADKDKVTVAFNETVTSASYDCVTSAAAGEITFTTPEGDELPAWLSATATGTEGAKYVTITFSQSSVNGGTTPVVVNFPNGTYAGFTVTTDALGGIDAPESSAEVVAREYYDIAGRRLNEAPRTGFFIEKAIRADGTSQSISRIR